MALNAPTDFGSTLSVRTNRAGPATTRWRRPTPSGSRIRHKAVTVASGPPVWDPRVTLRFTPHEGVSNVVEYQYTLNFEEHTVAASSDGSATGTLRRHQPRRLQRGRAQPEPERLRVSSEEPFGSAFFPWPGVTWDGHLSAL